MGYYSQFTNTPSFSEKYRPELAAAPNITLLTHANAVHLDTVANASAISGVRVRSFDGRQLTIRAKVFIVCCGGIETAR